MNSNNTTGGCQLGATPSMPNGFRAPVTFVEKCTESRMAIESWGKGVKALMDHEIFKSETDGVRDEAEMKANVMLAYRHLEDARMRLGKAIQAFDGGKSVYNK